MSQVNDWKQCGEVFLWRYPGGTSNYGGWHLTATDEGALSLKNLMEAFAFEGEFRHRKIKLSSTTEKILAVPNYRSKAESLNSLILDFNASPDHAAQWKLDVESAGVVRLRFGLTKLEELKNSFAGIPCGEGDYSVGPDDDCSDMDQDLWIWWHPSTRLKSGAV